ncbi:helix-turn-helix domain-containing protein [Kitasatospora sp. RG8]|uniref:helix-turn-helix domain-containing protein n=1 Tax=Kitasatospora sp. RG8 TaxID=2820815 RepID=UPI001AE065F3|nr:helix-turn-helix domain-containing protein [Kitasatospora sp. RG8]MBP0450829.1 helix-turn-helix domain-containing protein [Kitasatospora sp. RG8]
MPQYYSVEQVAELLGLHVRTVRGYVRDGRLKAARIGKQYRITAEDLAAFTGAPAAPAPAVVAPELRAEASTIVQVDGIGTREAARLASTVMAAISGPREGGRPLKFQTVHDEERSTLKVIVFGGLADTAELLVLINALIRENRHV